MLARQTGTLRTAHPALRSLGLPLLHRLRRASVQCRSVAQTLLEQNMTTSPSPVSPMVPSVDATTAATLSVQNMVQLCKDLKLSVTYKVNELEQPSSGDTRAFRVVVHVHADYAFKKYLNTCSATDLMLYRGLLIAVTTDKDVSKVKEAYVQQAFLPKFENEGQDSSIADQIVAHADERYMVVTIKHSGSLVTLSCEGFAAKNSVGNEYTAGAAVLLRAHFDRLHGVEQGAVKLAQFMDLLRSRRMAVSFEMVTACHGHHGQLPAAEYLVATAAHIQDEGSGKPRFLGWQEFLTFCLEQGLPVNDTWLFQGHQWAAAARTLLDHLSLTGGITGIALNRLNQLVQEGAGAGCMHVSGTYPHDQWQGSRLEGFVVAQGQPYSPALTEALQALSSSAARQVLTLNQVAPTLREPYKTLTGAATQQTPALERTASAGVAGTGPAAMVGAGGRGGGRQGRGGGRGQGRGGGGTPQPAAAPQPVQQPQPAAAAAAQDGWTSVGRGKGAGQHAGGGSRPASAQPAAALSAASVAAAAAAAAVSRPSRPMNPQAAIFQSAVASAQSRPQSAASSRGPAHQQQAAPASAAAGAAVAAALSGGRGTPGLQRQPSATAGSSSHAGGRGRAPANARGPRAGPPAPPAPPAPAPPPPSHTADVPVAATAQDTAPDGGVAGAAEHPEHGARTVGKDLVAQIFAQQSSWLPDAKLESAGGALREKIVKLILDVESPGPLVRLPNGQLMFVRHALNKSRPQDREAAFTMVDQYTKHQIATSGSSLLSPPSAKDLAQVIESCARSKAEGNTLAQAPRLLLGAPDLGSSLRYKKKMLMWHIGTKARAAARTPSRAMSIEPAPGTSAGAAAAANGSAAMQVDTPPPGTAANGGATANGSDGVEATGATLQGTDAADLDSQCGVGYCMMTFVIRNGLQSLSQGQSQYMGYVNHLARGWGLPERAVKEINTFARAWMAWVAQHGGVGAVTKGGGYLHMAEAFVSHFLNCLAAGDVMSLMGTRDKDAFQGVVLLLDEPNLSRAQQLQQALTAQNFIDLTEDDSGGGRGGRGGKRKANQCPPFSKALVQQGTVIYCPGPGLQREVLDLMREAGPCGYCVVVRREPVGDGQDAKRLQGMMSQNRKRVEEVLTATHPGASASAYLKLVDPTYKAAQVATWLGSGTALPPGDPAAICCFISIPGVGKTYLTEGLKNLPDTSNTPVTLGSLNSDRHKKTNPANRYWYDVASMASTNRGDGSVTVVIGDKNLVPSPPGNIQRNTQTLSDSGAVTVAVVPTWCGEPRSDVGVAYPEIPFPLELIALCMLRVLNRKDHEGGLDEKLDGAMRVVTMFALFYKHRSRSDLMDLVRGQFSVVTELPVIDIPSDPEKQVPHSLLKLIAEGLSKFNERGRQFKDQLPDAWEKAVRQELSNPDTQKRILAMQVPVEEARQSLGQALLQGLREAKAIAEGDSVAAASALTAGQMDELRPPRYIAVGGRDTAGALSRVVQGVLPGAKLNKFDGQYHVTLWHSQDPVMGRDHAMRDELLAAQGAEIEMQIVSIDHQDGVATAAQVQLLNAPEVALTKPYHHITLAIGAGYAPKDANTLPQRIEAGSAQRLELPEPLVLTGVVTGYY